LPLAALSFFLVQTVPVSIVIALTDGNPAWTVWTNIARMAFPYYVLSAGMASMVMTARQHVAWHVPLLVLPVMYGTYRSYQMYFGREAADPNSFRMAKAAAAGH
jgi:glycine/D-amino acid oxidase-like deaminating enzyme